ncbi:MAG: X-Pro dipeptidyl-peptidase, partial [Acidobacteria bacterium]|nr:X-Pro dipeptidyl-peptidase [Acidobacteriota bacterium]
MKRITAYGFFIVALVLAASFQGHTQQPVPAFDFTSVMVPMRDGVKLNTHIFAPKNQTGPLPIILERTP